MPQPKNKSHSPEELAAFLNSKEPLILVGGQAVNLWALHYFERAEDLAPFVSRDVDLLGNRETLAEVAKLAKAKPQYFPLRPPENEVGVVIAKDASGDPLLIEVLRYVHGVTEKELLEPTYFFEIGPKNVQVRVPSPVVLLKSKIANVADISQSGRQDERHVQILCRILPDYWRDLCQASRSGQLEERRLVNYLELALRVTRSSKGKSVLKKLNISPKNIFIGLNANSLPKIQSFIDQRLTRVL